MTKRFLVSNIFILIITSLSAQQKLWYKKPAKVWTEALPVGNGRLGAMVFGGVQDELLQLNEGSLWTGGPVRTNVNPGAYENLQIVRDALLNHEDYAKAYEYTKKMQGYYSESFLPMADLFIHQQFADTNATAYYRDLNIGDATATTRFTINGTVFTRQIISSAPDQIIAIRFTSSKPGQLNFTTGISGLLAYRKSVVGNSELVAKGKAASHIEPNYINSDHPVVQDDTAGCRGMRFEMQLKAVNRGGTVSADTSGITVRNATEVILFLSAATSFNGFDKCPDSQGKDEHKIATQYLDAASQKSWPSLLTSHLADYHKYFNRVSFKLALPVNNSNAALPTDERLLHYTEGAVDPSFENHIFSVWKIFIDFVFKAWWCSRKPAGDMEQRVASAMEFQLYHKHKCPDELLARRSR